METTSQRLSRLCCTLIEGSGSTSLSRSHQGHLLDLQAQLRQSPFHLVRSCRMCRGMRWMNQRETLLALSETFRLLTLSGKSLELPPGRRIQSRRWRLKVRGFVCCKILADMTETPSPPPSQIGFLHPLLPSVSLTNISNLTVQPHNKDSQMIRAIMGELVSVFKDIAQLQPIFREQSECLRSF
jgi:hypothetical protein